MKHTAVLHPTKLGIIKLPTLALCAELNFMDDPHDFGVSVFVVDNHKIVIVIDCLNDFKVVKTNCNM